MRTRFHSRLFLFLIIVGWCQSSVPQTAADEKSVVQFRRPVAVAVLEDGRRLIVANQRSGSVSIVDPTSKTVVSETKIGSQLSSLIATSDPHRFLVADEATHELLVIKTNDSGCDVERRIAMSPYPVSIKLNRDASVACVTSLWSRSVTIVSLREFLSDPDKGSLHVQHQIRLPFAPKEMLFLSGADIKSRVSSWDAASNRLLVADAFGTSLVMLDPDTGKIESVRELPAHSIGGLLLHPSRPVVVVSHQLLSRLAQSNREDVHWGALMVNVLRTIDLTELLDPAGNLLNKSVLEYLGGPDHGAGDPGAFVMRSDGVNGILLRGTDELLILDENHVYGGRVDTENYPTAITLRPDGKHAYVVNTFSDSISVVQLAGPIVVGTIKLGSCPEMTPADRGEVLFHSAKLSHDNWISCASCHVDGHTNGLLNDNKTDGSFGTAKRVLTLRGIGDTAPYSWNGRFQTLGEQIAHSVRSTMQGNPLRESQVADIDAYLKTLPAAPSVGRQERAAVERGAAIWNAQNCNQCHTEPVYTSSVIADVGLKDEQGESKFNPPSLRGVSQNAPYFHDGRATSLNDVFAKFRHQLDRELSAEELRDLIAFLSDL